MLTKLFEPLRIGGVELKNRIVMPALGLGYTERGQVTERLKAFYSERARGGVASIAVNATAVNPGQTFYGAGIFHDRFIPGLRQLTELIHSGGALAVAQLIAFPNWVPQGREKPQFVGPSDVVLTPRHGASVPQPLNAEEIAEIIEEIAEASVRAREAGFDGVEFHALAGESLPSQFLSPVTNKRTDEYGGSLDNRMRFLLQIIEKVRKLVGNDYLYMCRISGAEFVEGGHTLEDTKGIAQRLEKAGVHAISVATGFFTSSVPFVQMSVPQGAYVYLAQGIKAVVNIPVVTCTRITSPIQAEEILAAGKADLIGMARALIADPQLPLKAKEGRWADVRPCIACCYCFHTYQQGLACAVNARAGRESQYSLEPARQRRKVLVVGGGPAGMEAARIAAERGHHVALWEEKEALGGQLLLAAMPPGKQEISALREYLTAQLKKLGVQIKLGQEANLKSIEETQADTVLIATGGRAIIPNIPGVNGDNVVTALDVLAEPKMLGNDVIIIGGGLIGCETAEFLAQKGKKVAIVEMLDRIGNDIFPVNRWVVMRRLRQSGVQMETKAKVEEIRADGVVFRRDGASEFIKGDTVVIAVGLRPDDELSKQLQGKLGSVRAIGDCVRPQRIAEAIEEGFRSALET